MKKSIISVILCAIMVVGAAGCVKADISDAEREISPEKNVNDASNDLTEQEEQESPEKNVNDASDDLTEQEEQELDLMSKYFDIDTYISAYSSGKAGIAENKIGVNIDEIEVEGQIFKIGMDYENVIMTGFNPVESDFKNAQLENLARVCDFKNASGKVVRIGFAGEYDKPIAVENGFLYSVRCAAEDETDFSVSGVNQDTTISGIIDKLGNPYQIDTGAYSDFLDMQLQYRCKERSLYLTFYVNLETETIISVILEGYAE